MPTAVWRRIQTLYVTKVLDMMAGLTIEELGNFLQDEIFVPYLLASCGVNLDKGGGQLGSNMSSSTATGKFEIVRLSDCQTLLESLLMHIRPYLTWPG